jgi:hypothetical protein
MTFLPVDDLALWNLVEGPDGIYLSQWHPAYCFYPDAPVPSGAAVAPGWRTRRRRSTVRRAKMARVVTSTRRRSEMPPCALRTKDGDGPWCPCPFPASAIDPDGDPLCAQHLESLWFCACGRFNPAGNGLDCAPCQSGEEPVG